MEPERPVGWGDLWAVVKGSALLRLGKPLLIMYAALAVFGAVVVLISIALMYFG